jgi:hypothetical protein
VVVVVVAVVVIYIIMITFRPGLTRENAPMTDAVTDACTSPGHIRANSGYGLIISEVILHVNEERLTETTHGHNNAWI